MNHPKEAQSILRALIGINILLVMLVAFLFVQTREQAAEAPTSVESVEVVATRESSERTDALAFALAWSPNAKLSKLEKTDAGQVFTFVDAEKKGIAYVVTGAPGAWMGEEVAWYGEGGVAPERLLTSEQAIQKVLQIPGYETVTILGAELVYGPSGEAWYWGVRTERGVVTVNAKLE